MLTELEPTGVTYGRHAVWLEHLEIALERFAPLLTAGVLILFCAWWRVSCSHVSFQFDELLELSAATAPSVEGVLAFLAAGIDFNPPLSHLIIRECLHLPGPAELTSRLPALAGLLLLAICIYLYCARRWSRLYGLLAVLILLASPVRLYAIQARPYGLVLGLSGLLVLFYLQFASKARGAALAGVAFCSAALTGSHYYAVLVLGVAGLAELLRSWRRGKIDWAVLAAIVLPAAAVLWFLRDAIHRQKSILAHYFARGNLLSFKHGYDELMMDPLILCLATLGAAALLFGGYFASKKTSKGTVPLYENSFFIGLLLLPILGALITQFVTHAYVARYFLPSVIGFCICACWVVERASRAIPALALILVVSCGMGFAKAALQEVPHASESMPAASVLAGDGTPVLFDTPGTYVQAYYYLPELRQKMWVIADPAASLRYRQYDTDDKIMLALAQHGRAQAISLHDAVRRWNHFRLVPRSADSVWALQCLMKSRAAISIAQPFGASNFVFDIEITSDKFPVLDTCESSQ